MFSEDKQRKVLLLGPSGAGKSTICNALMNNRVDRESLSKPAKVSDRARGCTAKIQHYVCDNTLVVTDTIGFDDSRWDPETIAKELRTMILGAGIGYARIILCLQKGRISAPSRVYLKMLNAMFEKPETQMLLYISHCEEGTTEEDFIEANKDEEDDVDEEMGPLLRNLQERQEFYTANYTEVQNIIAGSMAVHKKDYEKDSAMYLQSRKDTIRKVMRMVNTDTGTIKIRTIDLWEMVEAFLTWLCTTFMNKALKGGYSLVKSKCFGLRNDVFEISYHYGDCAICLEDETNEDWGIIRCYHKFHIQCLVKLKLDEESLRNCPLCSQKFTNWEKLPHTQDN